MKTTPYHLILSAPTRHITMSWEHIYILLLNAWRWWHRNVVHTQASIFSWSEGLDGQSNHKADIQQFLLRCHAACFLWACCCLQIETETMTKLRLVLSCFPRLLPNQEQLCCSMHLNNNLTTRQLHSKCSSSAKLRPVHRCAGFICCCQVYCSMPPMPGCRFAAGRWS